jgi:hypothetical protein
MTKYTEKVNRAIALNSNSTSTNKVIESIFTATNNTANIPINIPQFNKSTDLLEVIDLMYNEVLQVGVNYNLNINDISIDTSWNVQIGEKVKIRVYKNSL